MKNLVQTKLSDVKKGKVKAEELATKQKEISISEFFTKNRHLLGFDNPRKALITSVKEAVDNSLDACEEIGVLPELYVEIKQTTETRYAMIIEDNGPGIVKEQIPKIFTKLLYGSKFFKLSQSLTGDEPLIIKKNGKIKIINIGDLIDPHIEKEGEIGCGNIEVPCFNWKDYKYSFKPISNLIKHKRRNEIYEVKTRYNKSVKVTGCHSLFTINKDNLNVEQIEARKLKKGDIVLAPKKIEINEEKNEINILNYIEEKHAKKQFWYLYTNKELIKNIFNDSKIIHYKKNGDKSRKYYRFEKNNRRVDVLDDSYKQYIKKGFLPVWFVKFLNLNTEEGTIRTYYHGKKYDFPIILPLTSSFMKYLGLFIAEGHTDNRQIGFTFSRDERDLVKLVCNTGYSLGVNYTIEERPEKNSVRVKFFGGILSYLFRKWCGRGAKNKKIPNFVFTASKELRQDCLDYLYVGDGHNTPNRNQLMLSTTSKELANQSIYLWLLNGVVASHTTKLTKNGLGKRPCLSHVITVCGDCINKSNYYSTNINTKRRWFDLDLRLINKLLGRKRTKEVLNYMKKFEDYTDKEISKQDFVNMFNTSKVGYKLSFLLANEYLIETNGRYCLSEKTKEIQLELKKLQILLDSDFMFLPIKKIKRIDEGFEYVYDISVPEGENFVGGFGGISCHNSRGQQGIGISAAGLYGQLTTGKPVKILSKIGKKARGHYYELLLNTKTNEPEIIKESIEEWDKDHGTRIEIEMEGKYHKGKLSVDEYLQLTAISNPHATITYKSPIQDKPIEFPRVINESPKQAKEIKPHPYGIELGILIKMLKDTPQKTLQGFLKNDFCRVSSKVSKEISDKAGLYEKARPSRIARQEADNLFQAIQKTRIMAPPTDCISPIGEEQMIKGMKKEIDAEFYAAVTKRPAVYRGNPFVIEAAVAYGGTLRGDELVKVIRFANRVPLQHQAGACAITKSTIQTAWRNYGLSQSRGALPSGPAVIMIHMASVWVPFTSESKEAIASYPEIIKEIKSALQECGRKLASHVRKIKKVEHEKKRKKIFEMYIKEVVESINKIEKVDKTKLIEKLKKIAQERTVGENGK